MDNRYEIQEAGRGEEEGDPHSWYQVVQGPCDGPHHMPPVRYSEPWIISGKTEIIYMNI